MATHAQKIEARATFITLMLREDHQRVRQLCDQFHDTTHAQEKRDILTAALATLKALAILKEELIYPAWRAHVGGQEPRNAPVPRGKQLQQASKPHENISLTVERQV